MSKNFGVLFSIVLCFIVVAALIQNFRAQRESQTRMAALEKKLTQQNSAGADNHVAANSPAPQTTSTPALVTSPLVIGGGESLPTDFARRQQAVEQIMAEGWKMINLREPAAAARAAELFQAGLEKVDDKSPDLYNGLGRALLIAGKPREAIAAWRKGLAIQPKLADMQSGIGWAYWNLHDAYHAKAAWDAALVIDPKSADAWTAAAWIELALGHKDIAKRGFQVMLARDNKSTPWIMGLAMAQAGNTDVAQIRQFFPVPDVALFSAAPATDPADDVAVNRRDEVTTSSRS